MIKLNELKPTDKPGYRVRGNLAIDISLPLIRETLLEYNDENYGLPITIASEQIKSGGLLNSQVEDCLILTNTEHSYDYFKYCITLKKQGKMATVNMRYYGQSKHTGEMNKAEERGKKLGGMLFNAIKGTDQAGFDAEYEYYDMLEQMFSEVFQ